MTNFVQNADIRNERKSKMRETLAVLKHFEVPKLLQEEIVAFQDHILEHNVSQAYKEILQGLPQVMQDHLGLYVKIRLIGAVPMFQKAHKACNIALAQSLTSDVHAPEEYIIIAGETGEEMYFMGHGFADVIDPKGNYLATLRKGAFFGEVALLIQTPRTANVKAITYCDLFRLDKRHFIEILRRFPRFRAQVIEMIKERFPDMDGSLVTLQTEKEELAEQAAKESASPALATLSVTAETLSGASSFGTQSNKMGSMRMECEDAIARLSVMEKRVTQLTSCANDLVAEVRGMTLHSPKASPRPHALQ